MDYEEMTIHVNQTLSSLKRYFITCVTKVLKTTEKKRTKNGRNGSMSKLNPLLIRTQLS